MRAEEHQIAAGGWGLTHRGLTSLAAVASAIAGTTLLTSAKGEWRIVAGILALVAAALSTLDTTLKAGQLAEDHKRGFDGFTRMRTKWLQFQDVTLRLGHSEQKFAEEFQQLVAERDQLSERVPAPPRWAKCMVAYRREPKINEVSPTSIDSSALPSTLTVIGANLNRASFLLNGSAVRPNKISRISATFNFTAEDVIAGKVVVSLAAKDASSVTVEVTDRPTNPAVQEQRVGSS
jgi:hypothetical protein